MFFNILTPASAQARGAQAASTASLGAGRRAASAASHWLQLALEEIDYGLVIVSHRGRVLHVNHVARAELAGDHPLQLVGEQLRTRSPADDGPIRDALVDAAERERRCMLTIGQAPQRLSVAVVPLPAADGQDEGVTLLMFSKRKVCEELSVEAFARWHGLTVAETQVLKALCAGISPGDAAASQGVRLSTVRTQIGSIRAKTGASNIRALMQQVACLPPLVGALRASSALPAEAQSQRFDA